MGRPPSNGTPAFRFSSNEVAEMENVLREHKAQVPSREALEALATKFSSSEERSGKMPVQMKQVWNWFQNRRYALRAKQTMLPAVPRYDSNAVRNVPQAPNAVRNVPQAPQPVPSPVAVQGGGRPASDNSLMEFEAKSARDGAWYDVASFLSHRSLETDTPEVLVRFAGFGAEEDEWVNIRKHVRPRSLPCESSECVAILPGDLILCFQEGKEQALYYDAHVIDSQRRRHDVRGCRCRFLVRYDHDQSEEIVPLRKVCRRPETDYRLLQLQSMNESGAMKQQKTNAETPHMGNTLRVYPPSESMPKLQKAEESLSHGNRPVATEVKIQQKKNPEMGSGATMKTPAVPPGFEAVTCGAAKDSNNSGDASVTIEAKCLETNKHDVIAPVAAEVKSLETKNPKVSTPVATEVKSLETKNPVVSAVGVVGTLMVPPGFEAATSVTEKSSTSTDTPIAMEVKSLQTKNPEVGVGDAMETTPVIPNNDALTSGTIIKITASGDAPVAPDINSLEIKNSELSAGGVVKIPTVPPAFEAVASGNTAIAMDVESPQTKNLDVSSGDAGGTTNASSSNEAVASVATPNSNVSADISIPMEVENPKVIAGDVGETSTVPPSTKALVSVTTISSNTSDLTESMQVG